MGCKHGPLLEFPQSLYTYRQPLLAPQVIFQLHGDGKEHYLRRDDFQLDELLVLMCFMDNKLGKIKAHCDLPPTLGCSLGSERDPIPVEALEYRKY